MAKKLTLIMEAALEDAFEEAKNTKNMKLLASLIIEKMKTLIVFRDNIEEENCLNAWEREIANGR